MTRCAKHGSEGVRFDHASQLALCEACEIERMASFEKYARGLRINFMMQERDSCAALAETLGSKEIANAIRARRD
jgi:hypothetical protein